MSFLNTSPGALATAAGDLTNIREVANDATAFASRSTTGILTAGADEVSAAITALFNSHAQTFNALAAQGESFHKQFASLLSGAGNTYEGAEQAALQSLRDAVTEVEQPFIPVLTQALGSFGFGTGQLPTPPLPTAPPGQPVALLVGGTGYPVLAAGFPVSSSSCTSHQSPTTAASLRRNSFGRSHHGSAARRWGSPLPTACRC